MGQYVLRRVLASIPTLVLFSLLIAGLIRLVPGDVVEARLAGGGGMDGGSLNEETIQALREDLGLDRSFPEQYIDWVTHAIRGDLGVSMWTYQGVTTAIFQRARLSVQLAMMAMGIALLIAIPLGVLSAIKQDSWLDYVARLFAVAGLSIPDFWIATMVLLALSLYIGWLPEFGYFPPWEEPWKNFQALIFPALIIGYRYSAISARMTRSAMLEVLRQDYVRTARAKGLTDRVVITRHALRNALIPVVTIMASQLSHLIGGLVVVETIFSLPGMGRLVLDSVISRDYPVVQGAVMMIAVVFVLANLLVDLSYAVIDPRIRYS